MAGHADRELREKIEGSEWSFLGADTGYLTHSIHRYSGKFIPQIAAKAIELLSSPGDLVVDSYCGSGTTLLEAALADRRAIGVDLNPLATLIATVKTSPVPSARLKRLIRETEQLVRGLEGGLFEGPLSSRDREDPRLSDDWYRKWFQPQVLLDLVTIHNAISDIEDDELRNIGLLAFSEILRRASNAHQGYPNVMFDRRGGQRPRPGAFYLKAVKQIAAAVESLPQDKNWQNVVALPGDARQLPVEEGTAQAVISHPPYIGSIPYAEYGALSLTWLGHNPKALDKVLTGGQRQSKTVLSRFSSDYFAMISDAFRVIKGKGYLFLMVGNPTIKGELVDLSAMTHEYASRVGFDVVTQVTRAAQNRRASKMGDETILVFKKP